MRREEMIKKAASVLPHHWRVDPPGGRCSCGHLTPLGRQTSDHVASAVLDAVLPQVRTATELEALHPRAQVMDRLGSVARAGSMMAHETVRNGGALTVVWEPDRA